VKPRMHGKSEVMAATCGDPVSDAAAFLSANSTACPPYYTTGSVLEINTAMLFPSKAERLMRDCYQSVCII
jgi:hypothetical protein